MSTFVNPWEEASKHLPRRAEHTFDQIQGGAIYQTMGEPMDAVVEVKKLAGSITGASNLYGRIREDWG